MPATASQFLDALVRSKVLLPEREQSLVQSVEGEQEQPDPQALARMLVTEGALTRFQAERLLAGKFRELRIGPYILTDLIGVGGMGAVYAGVGEEDRSRVAIKVLSPDHKQDAGMRTRFRMEARAGQQLRHPHLVRTLEYGSTDDVFGEMDYMVQELFPGIALHELLSVHGPLMWSMACDMISQAAAGLQHLHDRGLIHRDVKPDNLLVDVEGRLKLIDFGLALTAEAVTNGKVEEGGEEFSLTMLFGHDCLGTPDYMAPEQAANSLLADPRSDIYGLGCTFFTLLAGRRPYSAPNRGQLIEAHREQPVPRVSQTAQGIPRELDEIIHRMMAKRPEDRFPSMDAVVLALSRFAVRQPVRFKYSDLLSARRRLAERKSSIARLNAQGRSSTEIRAGVLAHHLATGVAAETDVADRTQSHRHMLTGPATAATGSTAAHAADIIANYDSSDAALLPVKARLVFRNGLEVPVMKNSFLIGRSEDCDLALRVADLSARHCSLTFDGERWVVRDHDSRNGVRVNGVRQVEAFLPDGCMVTIGGGTHFRFELAGDGRFSTVAIAGIVAGGALVLGALAFGAWWLFA